VVLDESIDAFVQPEGWRYEDVADERRHRLLSPASLDLLLEQIVANASIGNVVLAEPGEESSRRGISSHRITFRLLGANAVAVNAFDRLLNGVHGLRARFASSATAGAMAEGHVCRFVAHAIAAGNVAFAGDVDKTSRSGLGRQILAAMVHPPTKVWFDPTVDRVVPSTAEGKVSCARWLQSRADPTSVSAELSRDDSRLAEQQIAVLLSKGAAVPIPHALDVKSAFRTKDGREYVALSKRTRDRQIHLTGWA